MIRNGFVVKGVVWFLACIASIISFPISANLFGYQEMVRNNLEIFPQWLSVLERNIRDNVPEGDCRGRLLDSCHVRNWQAFIRDTSKLSVKEQLRKVNEYANKKKYILDIDNYGVEDYWATPRQFLYRNGDCEDYAITKMLSLKQLGFDVTSMKIVVLQDTNLKVAHAVLAVNYQGDTLIMDNQVEQVVSHKYIYHYVPIYSVNEKNWWMYLPE